MSTRDIEELEDAFDAQVGRCEPNKVVGIQFQGEWLKLGSKSAWHGTGPAKNALRQRLRYITRWDREDASRLYDHLINNGLIEFVPLMPE